MYRELALLQFEFEDLESDFLCLNEGERNCSTLKCALLLKRGENPRSDTLIESSMNEAISIKVVWVNFVDKGERDH